MALFLPITIPGSLVSFIDDDISLGTFSDMLITEVFINTFDTASDDIVVDIRDNTQLHEITIASGSASQQDDVDPYVSVGADTELFVRVTAAPGDAVGLSGWVLLQSAGWSATAGDEPVSLVEAKSYLRVDVSTDDDLIGYMIEAARFAAEAETRRALVHRTQTVYLDEWPCVEHEWWDGVREGSIDLGTRRYVDLPFGPTQSGAIISTFDDSDTETVFSSSNYYLDTKKGRITLREGQSWPTPTRVSQGIKIVYTVGYASPAVTPSNIKLGIMNHIGVMYEHRDTSVEMPKASKELYGDHYVLKDMI